MRKLSFLIAFTTLSLISTTTFAQEAQATEVVQQEKVEIKTSDLPEAVTKAVAADFQGYTIDKAFKSSIEGQDIFTVQLSKDGEALEINYTAEGKVVQ